MRSLQEHALLGDADLLETLSGIRRGGRGLGRGRNHRKNRRAAAMSSVPDFSGDDFQLGRSFLERQVSNVASVARGVTHTGLNVAKAAGYAPIVDMVRKVTGNGPKGSAAPAQAEASGGINPMYLMIGGAAVLMYLMTRGRPQGAAAPMPAK